MLLTTNKNKNTIIIMINSNNEYIYSGENACRNVITISEILYGTGAASDDIIDMTSIMNGTNTTSKINNLNSAGVREGCLRMALGCENGATGASCLRKWEKGSTTED